jgi:hypothetical protein
MGMITRKHLLSLVVVVLAVFAAVSLTGCSAPGRTSAEVHRNHINVIQTNWLMIQDDIDAALMLDKPSRLTEMTVR